MKPTKARYIRVSSKGQTTARQEAKQHPDERIFIDVISGAVPFEERQAAKELMFAIVMGEVTQVSVSSIDRLGRNAFNIQETLNRFSKYQVNVRVDNLGIESIVDDKPAPIFKMITDVLANVSQLERDNLKERQKEGLEAKKNRMAAGVETWNGRGENKEKLTDEKLIAKYKKVADQLKAGRNSLREIAKLTDTGLGTVQRVKAALERLAIIK